MMPPTIITWVLPTHRSEMKAGVLIIGSGSTTHNLRTRTYDNKPQPTWAIDFYEKAPSAKMAQPKLDHFYPLHVAIGAAGGNPISDLIHTSWGSGSISYTSFRFKTAN